MHRPADEVDAEEDVVRALVLVYDHVYPLSERSCDFAEHALHNLHLNLARRNPHGICDSVGLEFLEFEFVYGVRPNVELGGGEGGVRIEWGGRGRVDV